MKAIAYIQEHNSQTEQIRIIPQELNTEAVLDAVFDGKHYTVNQSDNDLTLTVTGFPDDSPFAALNGMTVKADKGIPESRHWEILSENLMVFKKTDNPELCLSVVSDKLRQAFSEL